ncbi:hypothetical protein EF405_11310 [Cyclobacteriaceae bacterium YHN15]|nr:hypothetical protein EF405_11310 [Cyclobacteriaceae bacterium YHN15]
MPTKLSNKKYWYQVSDHGIQFLSPRSSFIGWENIDSVQVLNDVTVKHPKSTFGFGLFLITSVLILIPIQKFSLPILGQEADIRGAVIVLFVYLLMMGIGIWSIRNALIKKPVLKIHFKSGGHEIIVLETNLGEESDDDIISSLTKHLGPSKVIFCKEAA